MSIFLNQRKITEYWMQSERKMIEYWMQSLLRRINVFLYLILIQPHRDQCMYVLGTKNIQRNKIESLPSRITAFIRSDKNHTHKSITSYTSMK